MVKSIKLVMTKISQFRKVFETFETTLLTKEMTLKKVSRSVSTSLLKNKNEGSIARIISIKH